MTQPICELHPAVFTSLRVLCDFLALFWMETESATWMGISYMSPKQLKMLRRLLYGQGYAKLVHPDFADIDLSAGLMGALVPHAVPLVDSFSIPDYVLNSALGSTDGRVYERLWDWATFGKYHHSVSKALCPSFPSSSITFS